jgi:xanthine dehydrogenase accessory factor
VHAIAPHIDAWLRAGQPVALATVIATWGSAPRPVGAKLAVTAGDRMAGSVSGGCVEAAVIAAARDTLATGRRQLLSFGVSDETAWSVGLACGGQIEVLVERWEAASFAHVLPRLAANEGLASATVLAGPAEAIGGHLLLAADGATQTDLPDGWSGPIRAAAAAALAAGRCRRTTLALADGAALELFVDVIPPRLTLVMVGGGHIAVALARMGGWLGLRTVVVDPRAAFATAARFPTVDRLLVAWPAEAFLREPLSAGTAVAVLSHDPKIDEPALALALPSPAYYVGALGGRATQAKRRRRLRELGLAETAIERLHGPIGLDIGARTPEEIAVAVLAEVVAAGRGVAEPSAVR